MTADGPDRGTSEYNEIMKKGGVMAKYLKGKYRAFDRRGRTQPPWGIMTDELREEVLQALQDPADGKKGAAHHLPHIAIFFEATGGIPKEAEARQRLFELIRPLLKENGERMIQRLLRLMYASQEINLSEAYKSGRVTPELAAILNDTYELPPDFFKHVQTPDRNMLIPYLLEEGKLDFSAIKKGADDKGDEWYFDYRISYKPFDRGAGLPGATLQQVSENAVPRYVTTIASLEADIKQDLEGIRPAEQWLREQMKLEGPALKKALKDYIVKPVKPEALLQFAEAVERQYSRRKEENTSRAFAAPFRTVQDTGFYVNPATCTIYDLRPYQEELHSLLSVVSWDYLKDFANTIREAVAEFKGEPVDKQVIGATAKRADKINYPVDKVNRKLWKYVEDTRGPQLAFAVEKIGSDVPISIIVGLDFSKISGAKISKQLTPFDKRVYIAVSALFNAGNEYVTLTQIHYAMGNTKRPNKAQLERINEAVTKMTTANFYIDNAQEIENKYKYKKIHYDGALLPMERLTATVNGQLSDAAIHIFREPPLITFAKERNQITTFEAKLLQSPISKTETNLAIDDYLIERIAAAKAAVKSRKVVINDILYETLYTETGINNRLQRARAKEKIKTYLDYYVECGYIKSYKMESDRINFSF